MMTSLIKKDWLLTTKNYFFYVTIFIAVLMVLVILFVIPEDTSIESKIFAYFDYDAPENLKSMYESVDSLETLDLMIEENKQSIGIIFRDENDYEYRLQGYETDQHKELMVLNTRFLNEEYYAPIQVKVTELKTFDSGLVSFNKLLLPLFHVMEPALLGMFLIATMIFSEKEENTITAYMTTPGTINSFLMSKTIVLIGLGLISLLVTTLLVVGFKANYFYLIVMTITCSFMGSALGLLLASFFDNITGAMMWILGGSLLMSLPFVTYFSPSFAPFWMKLIPTYYMLFAYKEAVFPTGNPQIIFSTIALSLVIGLVAYGISLMRFSKSLQTV
ncbi:ABC transporter permease [Acidaminobacter sp. JC074]|uniref:ABC transporter permease n=1 Tax=Acidaminobacter sp. JC074 TaxID=2530199 RepID=UPI001F10D747|nr:ABC transporter permease [Acidaminobacter sp. JC074]MCH4887982.1 ABC transporter permease [Acidaminobacter sp. JC074]